MNYISRMHGAACTYFSTFVQLPKVFLFITVQWVSNWINHHFRWFSSIPQVLTYVGRVDNAKIDLQGLTSKHATYIRLGAKQKSTDLHWFILTPFCKNIEK